MKRCVADTHVIVWYLGGAVSRLGRGARRWLDRADGVNVEVCVSTVSLWEVALLEEAGRVRLPAGFTAWCDAIDAAPGLRVEPVVRADIERARDVRLLRDPNDRLIVGAALRLGVPLLTADTRVTDSGVVPVVWG